MSRIESLHGRRVVIAGAGCSGLAFAWWLSELGGADWDIVIIDASLSDPPKKLWSFWGEVPPPARGVVERSFHRMAIRFPEWARIEPLHGQTYHSVRSERYVTHLRDLLSRRPNIRFIEDRIRAIDDLGGSRGAVVQAEGGEHHGRFVFQSCLPLGGGGEVRYPLRQHFGGWEVETELDQPESDVVTLMDFSMTAGGEMAFHYVIPLSPRRRLIEYTVFSPEPAPRSVYDEAVERHASRHVRGSWRRARSEYGVIPMEDRVFRQRHGQNIFNLGAMGGMTKPTTGYTFQRSQAQARHLAETLLLRGEPSPLPSPSRRFRVYDLILLHLLHRRPDVARRAFSQLFMSHRFEDVLCFLDERTSFGEELGIFKRMPVWPFLGAFAGIAPALPALAFGR